MQRQKIRKYNKTLLEEDPNILDNVAQQEILDEIYSEEYLNKNTLHLVRLLRPEFLQIYLTRS